MTAQCEQNLGEVGLVEWGEVADDEDRVGTNSEVDT